jgi:PAS domain S-box-containing protein
MASRTANRARDEPLDCQDELLELVEELVDTIFCMKSREGRYLAVNRAFVRRTGRRSKRDVLGKRASDLFAAPMAERYEAQDRQVFESGKPLRDELELIRREDGSLGWYLTTKLPVEELGENGVRTGLVSISRDLRSPDSDGPTFESVQDVVDHVRANLAEPLRVADLAAAAGCSPSVLDRRMKRVFGVSATQYVLRIRVERAAELLTTTEQSVADVAAAAGFYDQADLTRRFASLTGDTPAQYRRNHSVDS